MTITEFVRMAKRIHDAEGWNLGASSSRATRNAFFERAVGCAYWSHPVYNPNGGDKQWHCKDPDGPGGRPQSDDVIVSMPSRMAWDCIPGAGADGYRFEADSHPFLLEGQFIFVPSQPNGAGFPEPDIPPAAGHQCPPPPGYEELGGDTFFRAHVGVPLVADMAHAGQTLNDGSAVWFARTIYTLVADHMRGRVDVPVILRKFRNEWRAVLGLPPLS
jgi:hypothetical protein